MYTTQLQALRVQFKEEITFQNRKSSRNHFNFSHLHIKLLSRIMLSEHNVYPQTENIKDDHSIYQTSPSSLECQALKHQKMAAHEGTPRQTKLMIVVEIPKQVVISNATSKATNILKTLLVINLEDNQSRTTSVHRSLDHSEGCLFFNQKITRIVEFLAINSINETIRGCGRTHNCTWNHDQ